MANSSKKKIYDFEVLGVKSKKIGCVKDVFCDENEMRIMANAMQKGASMLRAHIAVRVYEQGSSICCYEVRC